jgi:hypothetical protein
MSVSKNKTPNNEEMRRPALTKSSGTAQFAALYLFLFFFLIYLLSASAQTFYSYESGQVHLAVTKSIVDNFDLALPVGHGLRGADGRDYSWLGLGFPICAVPFYLAGKLVGGLPGLAVSLMNQIFGALTAVLVFLFCLQLGYSKRASFWTSLLFGLGTFAWPQTKQPFDNVLEAFFVLLSVFLVHLYYQTRKSSSLFFSACSLGFAFLTRPTSLLAAPAICLYMVSRYFRQCESEKKPGLLVKNVIFLLIVFLPFLSLFLWYNYYRFGSLFETGYSLIASRTGIDFFTGTSFFTGLDGLLASPGKGFFFYSPAAVLFFFSINSFRKKNPESAVCFISIILCYLFFLSKYVFWHGDWTWGPRYLLVITPYVMIPAAGIFDASAFLHKIYVKALVSFVFLAGALVQLAAVSVEPNKYFYDLKQSGVKFVELRVDGVQPVVEPPKYVYFDWRLSPLFRQVTYIVDAVGSLQNYAYSKTSNSYDSSATIRSDPAMNLPDFWWVYKYYLEKSWSGFIAAFFMLLTICYIFTRSHKKCCCKSTDFLRLERDQCHLKPMK